MMCCCLKKNRKNMKRKPSSMNAIDACVNDGITDFLDDCSTNAVVRKASKRNLPTILEERPLPGSPERRASFSSIFSSFGDLFPQMISRELPKEIDVDVSPIDGLEEKLVRCSQSSKKYYTLTWTTPETNSHSGSRHSHSSCSKSRSTSLSAQYRHHGTYTNSVADNKDSGLSTCSVRPVRFSSSSSQSYENNHLLRLSYDRQTKLSSAPTDLTSIPEGSMEGVDDSQSHGEQLATSLLSSSVLHGTNAYFPNPNTPVSADLDSESNQTFTINLYHPPHNTPLELSCSETSHRASSSDHIRYTVNHKYKPRLDVNRPTGHLKALEHEQEKLRIGKDITSLTSKTNHNMSLTSRDLSYLSAAVPVHCSTIGGATSDTRLDMNGLEQLSLKSQMPHDSHSRHQTTASSDAARTWYQNQAYDDILASNFSLPVERDDENFMVDVSSSGIIHGGYNSTCTSCAKLPSGQTSMNAQVGSYEESSSHQSDNHDLPYAGSTQHLVQYSMYTDSTNDSSIHSGYKTSTQISHYMGPSRHPASLVLRAPANSPQTLVTEYSEYTTSSGRWAGDEKTDSRNTSIHGNYLPISKTRQITANQPSIEYLETPVLSPKIFWV